MSGYLRDIQLRKQLEEKVKEATKNRQQAEKELAEANQTITACKGIDAPTTEAEVALAEATSAISAKDYKHALDKALEAKEKAKKSYAERASAIVDSSATLLGLAKNMGVGVSDGETAIGKAKDALAKEDYETAIDLASKNWKKYEKIVHEHVSKSYSNAQSLIMTAKNLGKDTVAVEDILSRARSAVEGNDFELALSYTKECLETVKGELSEEVAKSTAEVDALINAAKEVGVDVTKMTSLVERSKADAAKLEFQKAVNALRQSKAEGEKAIQKALDSKFSEMRGVLDAATSMGAEVGKGKGILEEASAMLQEGNYQQAAELGRQAVQEIQAAEFQRVLITIAQSRDKFVAARNIGADITPAVEMLNKARQALQKGDFEGALNFAKVAEEQADGALDQFRQVESTVRDLGRDFIEAESLGVNAASARRFLERAKKDIAAKDFSSALEEVRKAREELSRSEYERTMEVMEQSEFIMTLGERMAANLEEASKLLEDSIVSTKEKEYRKAIAEAQGASRSAETAIKNQLTDALAALRGSVGFLADDASNVRSLVDKAEGAMAARDYDGAFTFVSEARKFVERRTKDKGEEFRAMLRLALELGTELGAPVDTVVGTIAEVDDAANNFDYAKILSIRDRGYTEAAVVGESVFNLIKDKLVEARNLRINIDDALQLLKKARMALSVGELPEAFRLMAECNGRVTRLTTMHKETYTSISSAAALVAEAKKKDVDVTPVLEMLLEAKKSFEKFDYERALELSNKAKAETEKLMLLYSSAQSIITTKEKLELATRLEADTARLRDKLEMAKEAMKNKAYEEALEVSADTQQALDEVLEQKIRSVIAQSESILEMLSGVPMSEQRDKLSSVKELLERRDWNRAGEIALAARGELEKAVKSKEEAAVLLKKTQDMFSEVEALNIETPDARKLFERSEKAAKSGAFEEALALTEQSMNELERERDLNINKTIDKFRDAIEKAKREGIDTRSADKLLEKAKQQFREKRYRQALALAMQSEAEAERIGLQQDMAAKAIMTAEKKFKGFGQPMPEVSNFIGEAQKAFDEGDYVRGLDLAIRAGDSFNKYKEMLEETQETRSRAEKITLTAHRIGADAEKLDKIIEEARQAYESGDARAARDAFQQCVEWGLGICRSYLEKLSSQVDAFAEGMNALNIDSAPILKKMTESKAYMDSENFESSFDLIQEAKRESLNLVVTKVRDAIVSSETEIAHAKTLSADVAEAEQLLAEAKRSLEDGQFEKALRSAMESVSRVESRREFEKRFVDFSYKAESTMRNARKYGIEVIEAEKMLEEAIRIKKTDLAKAIQTAEKAHSLAMAAVEGFAPKMEASLDVSGAVIGERVSAWLTVVNTGKALAKDVKVKILGDAVVEGLQEIPTLRAKGDVKMPLKIKMTATGSVPLAIQIVSHRLLDGTEYSQELIVHVKVAEQSIQAGPVMADREGRCLICKGSIKIGFRIMRCSQCGKDYHEMCASRAGACPSCQNPFSRTKAE